MPENHDDILTMLSARMGRKEADKLCRTAISQTDVFSYCFKLMFGQDKNIAWHAAWIIGLVSQNAPELFSEQKTEELITFTLHNRHNGLQRLSLSILSNLPLSRPVTVAFINRCFEQAVSPKETVGVQMFSMKILGKICNMEPDFIPELIFTLENTNDQFYSKGFISAKRNMLKRLKLMTSTERSSNRTTINFI